MSKKAAIFLVLAVLSIPCIWLIKLSIKEEGTKEIGHLKCSQGAYFFPITITKFTAANQPCLDVKIGEYTASVMLDLGFRGQFGFSSAFLKKIENKTKTGSIKMYGVRGTEYTENLFSVSQISIGPLIFFKPELHEYSESFQSDCCLARENDEPSPSEPGKIGWELFSQTNLFLDLKHSKVAFCDSLSTLKQQGHKTGNFIKTPLLLERGLVEFKAKTSCGPLLCMLDTGATVNVLNTKVNEDCNTGVHQSFKINSRDLGPIEFHPFPINMPIFIEAILGMEFFKERVVFLDFSEKQIYFLENHLKE